MLLKGTEGIPCPLKVRNVKKSGKFTGVKRISIRFPVASFSLEAKAELASLYKSGQLEELLQKVKARVGARTFASRWLAMQVVDSTKEFKYIAKQTASNVSVRSLMVEGSTHVKTGTVGAG